MVRRRYLVKSKVDLPGEDDYNLQIEDLKETFEDFCLIKYKIKKIGDRDYNVFTFYHNLNISVIKSRY
jgi:hypothetical protein